MLREELIAHVKHLGRAFVERGMTAQARKLRLYYLALTHNLTEGRHKVNVHFTEEFVIEWLSLLDLPPFQGFYERRAASEACPRCPLEQQAPNARHSAPLTSVRTMMVFPGGAKMVCLRCQHAWVVCDSNARPPGSTSG